MAGVRSGGERMRGQGVVVVVVVLVAAAAVLLVMVRWCGREGEKGWLVVKRQEGERSELTGR